MMRGTPLLALLLACSPLLAQEGGVLGRAGGKDVLVEDIRPALSGLTDSEIQSLSHDPAALNKLVRSLVVQRMVLQKALEKKWDERPEVAERIRHAREVAITDSYLKSVSTPPDSYPNDTELRAAYEARRASLMMPQTFHLAQIYIADPRGQDKELAHKARERLDKVRELVRAPKADFAAIAREYSEERESAARGGEIGWLTEKQIQPEILAKLPSLSFNVPSEAIRLDDGWHFIKVLDARQPFTPPLEQLRPELIRLLRAERTRAETQSYLSKLLQETPLVINELALSKLLPAAAPNGTGTKP
ncbi:peptidylprolyl isomerase [Prosthecobacter sp.]|uniref:peptidylprolyl isomerase n=1 Tax=Prosthecobacter sp. TaxID=1965333 RepID=UPI0037840314